MEATWYAEIRFRVSPPIAEEHVDQIVDALLEHHGVLSFAQDGRSGGVNISVEATNASEALERALNRTREVFRGRELGIVEAGVKTEEEMDADLARPVFPEVVGYAEIADIAGVSRQRARQFADIDGFPEPVIVTASGPLRTRSSIEAWVSRRNTRPGRPKGKTAVSA